MKTSIFEQQDGHSFDYYQPYLFPEMEETEGIPYAETTTVTSTATYEDNGPMNIELFRSLSFTSTHEMPVVKPYNGGTPQYLVPHYRLKNTTMTCGVCPCFYTADRNFERAWSNPRAFSKTLMRYSYVLSPDFSVYLDMPRPMQLASILKNKALAAWWQECGLNVIPSVSWTTVEHIEEDLEGWPKHSVIAINSTRLGRDRRAKHNWVEGYEATISILEPSFILRYGARQDGEKEEISRYYPNCNRLNLKPIVYGR